MFSDRDDAAAQLAQRLGDDFDGVRALLRQVPLHTEPDTALP